MNGEWVICKDGDGIFFCGMGFLFDGDRLFLDRFDLKMKMLLRFFCLDKMLFESLFVFTDLVAKTFVMWY